MRLLCVIYVTIYGNLMGLLNVQFIILNILCMLWYNNLCYVRAAAADVCIFFEPSTPNNYQQCTSFHSTMSHDQCENFAAQANLYFATNIDAANEDIYNDLVKAANWYPSACSMVTTNALFSNSQTKTKFNNDILPYVQWFDDGFQYAQSGNICPQYKTTNTYTVQEGWYEGWQIDQNNTFWCICQLPKIVSDASCCAQGHSVCPTGMELKCADHTLGLCVSCICQECGDVCCQKIEAPILPDTEKLCGTDLCEVDMCDCAETCSYRKCDPGMFRVVSTDDARFDGYRNVEGLWKVAHNVEISNALDTLYVSNTCQSCYGVREKLMFFTLKLEGSYTVSSCSGTDHDIPIIKKCPTESPPLWTSSDEFNNDLNSFMYMGFQECEAGEELQCNASSVFCAPCSDTSYKPESGFGRCESCPDCGKPDEWRQCLKVEGPQKCTPCDNQELSQLACPSGTYKFCGYVFSAVCLPCEECPEGMYRVGCGELDKGSCQMCPSCNAGFLRTACKGTSEGVCEEILCESCGETEVRVGCGIVRDSFHTGRCVQADKVQQTTAPECSYDELANKNYIDEMLTRLEPEINDMRCSKSCDGTGETDTQRCVSPYPCGVLTCLSASHDHATEAQACPVVRHFIDPIDIEVTLVNCEKCSQCGQNAPPGHKFTQWGAGCARECSFVQCEDSFIFDWTDGACKQCKHIWNNSICSRDFHAKHSLQRKDISGNFLAIYLPDCNSDHQFMPGVAYGDCEVCPFRTCDDTEYPNYMCECAQCLQKSARHTTYLDELGNSERLNCQIFNCESSSNVIGGATNHYTTGVDALGALCLATCTTRSCLQTEFFEPCLLPHDSKCTQHYPAQTLSKSRFVRILDNANVLETYMHPWHRWASFENILMRMDVELNEWGYQCVWNAAGILDNTINPGGVNNVFWKVGETSATLYEERGTQICRQWPLANQNNVQYNFLPYPRLPLQNTVSFDGSEYGRRILINTTARVLSYDFLGKTSGIDDTEIPPHKMPIKPTNFVDVGRQFLCLTLQGAPQTDLIVHIPTDRQELLQKAGISWWRFSMFAQELLKTNDAQETQDTVLQLKVLQTRSTIPLSYYSTLPDSLPELNIANDLNFLSNSMQFGTWIDTAFDVCDPISTNVTWGWWNVSLENNGEAIVTSEEGNLYCKYNPCSFVYYSMTSMPHREHVVQTETDFEFDEILTSVQVSQNKPSLDAMAIVSMAETPVGHQCLAYAATLTSVYCVALISPTTEVASQYVELQKVHSCYTENTPTTIMRCMHLISIAYDTYHKVLFIADRQQMHIYSDNDIGNPEKFTTCQHKLCMQFECPSSYYANLDTAINMSQILAITVYQKKMFFAKTDSYNVHYRHHIWQADIACTQNHAYPACNISNFDYITAVLLQSMDNWIGQTYTWTTMPICSMIVSQPNLTLACYDTHSFHLKAWQIKFTDSTLNVMVYNSIFFQYSYIKDQIEQHKISSTSTNTFRLSTVSLAHLKNNRTVIGVYGYIFEMTNTLSTYLSRINASMLQNGHFVPHAEAFVVFDHTNLWPHQLENNGLSCRNGYYRKNCPVIYNENFCLNSHENNINWTRKSWYKTSIEEACYMTCLENDRCFALSSTALECLIWTYEDLELKKYAAYQTCCAKNIPDYQFSAQFLTTNRITVKVMMYGDTKLLTTSSESAVGSHSWARSDMFAQCMPYYYMNGQLHALKAIDDFRKEIVNDDSTSYSVFEYSIPDALIIMNQKIEYPFALQIQDHHIQITMTHAKFVEIRVPCATTITGFPDDTQTTFDSWYTEDQIFTHVGLCDSPDDIVILVMAYTSTVFVRVYMNLREIVFFSSPVESQARNYALLFFLHQTTTNKLTILETNADASDFAQFKELLHTTIFNLHKLFVGNDFNQLLQTFTLSTESFTKLDVPIPHDCKKITLQTHRPNQHLSEVRYVAIDEIQILPIFTFQIGWKSHDKNNKAWLNVLNLPEESILLKLGTPIISDGVTSYVILHIEIYFLQFPLLIANGLIQHCSYRIGLIPISDAQDMTFTYSDTQIEDHLRTANYLPPGCTVTDFILNNNIQYQASCDIEVHFNFLNINRQVIIFAKDDLHGNYRDYCASPAHLIATTPARYTMYHCDTNFYWDENLKICQSCFSDNPCNPGHTPIECSNVLNVEQECAACTTVLPQNAHYVKLCDFKCNDGYYMDSTSSTCMLCKQHNIDLICPIGFFFEACTESADSQCQACNVEDPHTEFIESDLDIPCQFQCIDDYFLSDTGRCMPCTQLSALQDAVKIIKNDSNDDFFRFIDCTKQSNSFFQKCEDRVDGMYTNDGDQFNIDCQFQCSDDWQSSDDEIINYNFRTEHTNNLVTVQWSRVSCIQCSTLSNVPRTNYKYNESCKLHCLNGWIEHDNSCVDCTATNCMNGQYVNFPACDVCHTCTNKPTFAVYTGKGNVNDAISCPWQCDVGYYNEFNLGTCKPHSIVNCNEFQYKVVGNQFYDSECRECSSCEGKYMQQSCTIEHDSVCSNCLQTLSVGEMYVGYECEIVCRPNYVRNQQTFQCELCSQQCPVGFFFPDVPQDCSDCQPCPSPPVSDNWEWLQGCVWSCKTGFIYSSSIDNTYDCVLLSTNIVPSTQKAIGDVRCPFGFKLDDNYNCIECSSLVHTPPMEELDKKWTWNAAGNPCTWTCIPPLVEYTLTDTFLVLCVDWNLYKKVIANQHGLLLSLPSESPAPGKKQITFASVPETMKYSTWQIAVAVSGVLLLAFLIMCIK